MDGIIRTEIDLPAAMAQEAAREGIDLAHLLQETLRRELRRRRMEQAASETAALETAALETAGGWTERNRAAVEGFNRWIAENGGSIADDYRPF